MNQLLFDGLDADQSQEIELISRPVTFQRGDYLMRQGEPNGEVYLVQAGTVAVQIYAPGRGGKTIDTAGPGDYVGWSWIVEPFRAHYDAVAQEAVVATAINARSLRELCEQNHELGYRVLGCMVRVMEQRLHGTRFLLMDFYGNSK